MLIATGGTLGDIYPFLRLALALQARGAQVCFYAPSVHAELVRQAGVDAVGLGTEADYLAAIDNPAMWDSRKGFGIAWHASTSAMDQLLQLLLALDGSQPTAMLVHPLAMPVAAIAQALRPGWQLVGCALAPSNLRTHHGPQMLGPMPIPRWMPKMLRRGLWRLTEAALLDPVTLPGINAQRARHGLAPVRCLIDHLQSVPDLTLALWPAWFAPTQPDWPQPVLHTGFPLHDPQPDAPLPADIQQFLAAGAPPLVVTAGTGQRFAAALFTAALQASAALGLRCLLLTPHRAQIPDHLPAGVAWAASLPLQQLLPQAAALVHHGGIGTTAEALRAGTRQLVIPRAFDQFDNAARVCALGCGLQLAHRRVGPGTLQRRLSRLLASAAIASRCAALARRSDWPAAQTQPPSAESALDEAVYAVLQRLQAATGVSAAMQLCSGGGPHVQPGLAPP